MEPNNPESSTGRSAVREAMFITVAGILLGFGYTLVSGKGLYSEPAPVNLKVAEYPPEYIGYEETYAAFEQGGGVIVDSRNEYDYELGHIRGSINLPLKEFEARKEILRSWQKDTLIITYCDGQECNSSIDLATKLAEAGFTNVKFFFGGWSEWQEHQSPVYDSTSRRLVDEEGEEQ